MLARDDKHIRVKQRGDEDTSFEDFHRGLLKTMAGFDEQTASRYSPQRENAQPNIS